jgi:type I restriction-modification system DNA methylase subunit
VTTLTLSQLENHLWRAADILRGSIDFGDYKHYIFGLLFFKRLSDVGEEEYEERLARYTMSIWPLIRMSTASIFPRAISGRTCASTPT